MPKITIGIRGLRENLFRDDGIEDPIGNPWCPCTPNNVPFSEVNVSEHVKVRETWGPTFTPLPFLYLDVIPE